MLLALMDRRSSLTPAVIRKIDGVGKVGGRQAFPIDMQLGGILKAHVEAISVNVGPTHGRS